jgi:hypothetical protein
VPPNYRIIHKRVPEGRHRRAGHAGADDHFDRRGFGARIREVKVPDFAAEVKESVEGTALAHLANGLFEAHARDEAGHRNEGGHKQMWEAARDLGLAARIYLLPGGLPPAPSVEIAAIVRISPA